MVSIFSSKDVFPICKFLKLSLACVFDFDMKLKFRRRSAWPDNIIQTSESVALKTFWAKKKNNGIQKTIFSQEVFNLSLLQKIQDFLSKNSFHKYQMDFIIKY